MTSNNLHIISVSNHCMVIAKQLKMDDSEVVAALQHLTENNMLLYFQDVMKDIVFAGVHVFFKIFAELYKTPQSACKQSLLFSGTHLETATKHYTNAFFPTSDFIKLFNKLLIVAPYNHDFLIPTWLQLLSSTELYDVCSSASAPNIAVAYIKCPSKGYEYICMLIVFLVTLSSPKWMLLEDKYSGHPVCLYKNCAKYSVEDKYEVTISLVAGVLHVYVNPNKLPLKSDLRIVSSSILQGLEKIKLILNLQQQQSFDFVIFISL